MRYAISLTSIPPRLPRLGPVIEALLAQRPSPEEVFLTLPRRYARFPGRFSVPSLPRDVRILWADNDEGPAAKALSAARHLEGSGVRLIYCDDDWIYPNGWAAALLTDQDQATTGQAWDLARLGRKGTGCDIAQGFAGVCVRPDWLAGPESTPPDEARAADDVWLSAVLAHHAIPVKEVKAASIGLRPAYSDDHGLQDATIHGRTRDTANRAAAACAEQCFGIWPQL